MDVKGVGTAASVSVQALIDMRNQLTDLQRQLGTGEKSVTYAGLGLDRGLTVGLRNQLSAIDGYQAAITQGGVRLDVAQTALSQITSLAQSAKTTALTSLFKLNGGSSTPDQTTALSQFDQVLSLLNTKSGDRSLFSGRDVDQPAVETSDHILNGFAGRAGLKQMIDERHQADLGASGLGRLVVSSPTATSVAVTEDAVSPFGFKLAGVNSTLSGATITGPSAPPASIGVDLGATNPSNGQTLRLTFTLPDGSSQDLTLTATTSATPGPGQFTIGPSSAATATNLSAALTQSLGTLASTALSAASAVAAGNNLFNTDDANPPQRVAGPPFNNATALVDGTSANTVSWYTGDAGSDPARSTAIAQADRTLTVSYGMRANEQALRNTVQSIAVFAAMSFSASDPNAEGAYAALRQRTAMVLAGQPNQQKISDIQGELAGAQTALASTKDRHQQAGSALEELLQQVQGAPNEEVAAKILMLQTSLQATLQTTALLLKTSLINYL